MNTHTIPELFDQIQTSEDGSNAQKVYFDKLLPLTQPLLNKYNYNRLLNICDVEEAKNSTLMGVSGCDRANQTTKKTITRFLQSLPENIDTTEIIIRYEKYINRIFKNKLVDIFRRNKQTFSLDAENNNQQTYLSCISAPTLSGLDQLIAEEELLKQSAIITAITDYINNDPEGLLKNCHPKGYPQANAQELLQIRLLAENVEQWRAIALRLNIPYGTVTSHYKRKCLPLIQKIAQAFLED